MRLSDHLDLERILVPLVGTTKEEVLQELVELAIPDLGRQEEILSALRRREAIQSTGIGQEVAIPHCIARIDSEIVVAAGVHPEGVDFGAADGSRTRLFFLVVSSPGGRSRHLQMLTCISKLLGQDACRLALLDQGRADSFLRTLLENEALFLDPP